MDHYDEELAIVTIVVLDHHIKRQQLQIRGPFKALKRQELAIIERKLTAITSMLTKHVSGHSVLEPESFEMACAHCIEDLANLQKRHATQYVDSLNSDDESDGQSGDDSEDLEDEDDSSEESTSEEEEEDEGYDSASKILGQPTKRKRDDNLSSDDSSESSDESTNDSDTTLSSDISEFGSRPIKKLRIMSTCIICEGRFDALHNADGQCRWHSGKYFLY